MSGYTRQSAADIVPTAVVKAAPINTEFNKIRDAFTFDVTGSTGHRHDGTSDEGSYVPLIADLDGLNKLVIDTSNDRISFYVEVSAAAVEQLRVEDGVVYPVTTNDIDLGTGSLQFKDGYFDGTVRTDTLLVDESATITVDLTVNGNTTLGNAATDTVTITADVASNIIPSADSTYTLGDATNYWSHGYIDAITTTGDVTVGGNFSVTGTADFTNTTLDNVTDPTSAQQAATKNYVDTAISDLIGGAPGTLDTLDEIAAAINDDANVYTTLASSIALKLPLAGGTMSGNIVMGGNRVTGAALTPATASELTSKSYVDSILGSATAASASAAAAAISETNAAASYDSFDDRYLGAKASAPTVDNDGDALLTGALYFNSTSNDLWIWDGAAWVQGAFTAGSLLSNIVEDVTPQLGGDLDLNGSDITGTGVIDITGSVTITGTLSAVDSTLTGTLSAVDAAFTGTGAIDLPAGTTGDRPTPSQGMLRYNTTESQFEGYDGAEWGAIGGGGDVQTATTTSVTETAIATYVLADALGLEATIVTTDTVATERTITKLLVTHDGVTAVATQYGEVNTATAVATFDVDISGGNVRILATAASTNSTNYTVNATLLA